MRCRPKRDHPAGSFSWSGGVARGLFYRRYGRDSRQINQKPAFQDDQLEASRESTVCCEVVGV